MRLVLLLITLCLAEGTSAVKKYLRWRTAQVLDPSARVDARFPMQGMSVDELFQLIDAVDDDSLETFTARFSGHLTSMIDEYVETAAEADDSASRNSILSVLGGTSSLSAGQINEYFRDPLLREMEQRFVSPVAGARAALAKYVQWQTNQIVLVDADHFSSKLLPKDLFTPHEMGHLVILITMIYPADSGPFSMLLTRLVNQELSSIASRDARAAQVVMRLFPGSSVARIQVKQRYLDPLETIVGSVVQIIRPARDAALSKYVGWQTKQVLSGGPSFCLDESSYTYPELMSLLLSAWELDDNAFFEVAHTFVQSNLRIAVESGSEGIIQRVNELFGNAHETVTRSYSNPLRIFAMTKGELPCTRVSPVDMNRRKATFLFLEKRTYDLVTLRNPRFQPPAGIIRDIGELRHMEAVAFELSQVRRMSFDEFSAFALPLLEEVFTKIQGRESVVDAVVHSLRDMVRGANRRDLLSEYYIHLREVFP